MWSDGASQLRLLYRCHRHTHTHTKYRCLSNGSLQQLVNTDFIQNKAAFREFDVAPMQGETNTVSEGWKGNKSVLMSSNTSDTVKRSSWQGVVFFSFFEVDGSENYSYQWPVHTKHLSHLVCSSRLGFRAKVAALRITRKNQIQQRMWNFRRKERKENLVASCSHLTGG